MRKNYLPAIIVLIVALFAFVGTVSGAAIYQTVQGGTGTSSPQGILYGSGSSNPLKTATIGTGLLFSGGTLSATGASFSTTSADYWKTQNNFYSTTSAEYWVNGSTTLPKTYSSNTFTATQTFGNSTTSNATSSISHYFPFLATPAGSILAVDPSGKLIATTTSAGGVTSVSGTYPVQSTGGATPVVSLAFGTTSNNAWSGTNVFTGNVTLGSATATSFFSTTLNSTAASSGSETISNVRSSILYTGTTGTVNGVATSSCTINSPLTGSLVGISTCSLSINQATGGANGYLSSIDWTSFNSRLSTTTVLLIGNGQFFSTTSANVWSASGLGFSTTSANYYMESSTTVPTMYKAQTFTGLNQFTGGIRSDAYTNRSAASLTIGTLTNNDFLFQTNSITGMVLQKFTNNVGIGSTSPMAKLTVQQIYGATSSNIFQIASSTSSTGSTFSTFLSVSSTGFGTTTLSGLNISGSATSTSNVGFNITTGCYAVSGTCITGGGAASLTGTLGQMFRFTGTNAGSGTSTLFMNDAGRVGIGTTTFDSAQPAKLSIEVPSGDTTEEAISVYGNVNDFLEGNIKNVNTGANAQSCWTSTANSGSLTNGFISMCANNSNFWNPQTYNVGGAGDTSIMGLAAGDFYVGNAQANKNLYLFAGGTGTSTPDYRRVSILGSNGNVGIGTSTPWAKLSILATSSETAINPIIAVATSSDPFGFLLGLWATTSVMTTIANPTGFVNDSGARFTIGTAKTYNYPGLLDQVTLNGRVNTLDWHFIECAGGSAGTLSAAAVSVCGPYSFQIDTAGGFSAFSYASNNNLTGLSQVQLCTGSSPCPVANYAGGSANAGSGLFYPNTGNNAFLSGATSTPVFETAARIQFVQNATSTANFRIGFFGGFSPSGAAFETEPTGGCYFNASSTSPTGNWYAVCRTSSSAATYVDTGFASSTVITGTGGYYRFRIQMDSTGASFYMASSTATLTQVARITTTYDSTIGTVSGIYISQVTAALARAMQINYIKLWFYQPVLNYSF